MNENLKDILRKRPRHKWFSHCDKLEGEGWFGPHDTIEQAAMEAFGQYGREDPVYVAQGFKLTKAKIKEDYGEYDPDYDWEVDSKTSIKISLS